jgi:hypothetical protein
MLADKEIPVIVPKLSIQKAKARFTNGLLLFTYFPSNTTAQFILSKSLSCKSIASDAFYVF